MNMELLSTVLNAIIALGYKPDSKTTSSRIVNRYLKTYDGPSRKWKRAQNSTDDFWAFSFLFLSPFTATLQRATNAISPKSTLHTPGLWTKHSLRAQNHLRIKWQWRHIRPFDTSASAGVKSKW